MSFDFQPATVSLSDIDTETETFRITTNQSIGELASAMDRVGLTNPPILESAGNGHRVVCGFRRIAAGRSLGWTSIPVRILPDDVDALSCALLSISENSAERPLNLIETSRAFSMLSSLVSDDDKLLEIAKEIGLPGNLSLINKIMPLCSLPQPLQRGILSGDLALPSVQMLSRLTPETSIVFADFLSNLKLSLHKQRELIGIIFEISKIEECSIESLLTTQDVRHILDDSEMELPRKAGKIREYFKRRRFPHLTAAAEEFERLLGRLKLGEHVSLTPPPGFEGNRYALSLSFASLPEFERQVDAIEKLSKQADFIKLLCSRDPNFD